MYPGSWNATVVKQDGGLVLLESPLSGTYMAGVIDKAKRQNPDPSLKAVLSTSDSWPHVGGVRQVVALGLPVYILDLNKLLLERLVASPRHLLPDLLAQLPRHPAWRISDTLALNADGSLYAPELMREVMDAVKREHLEVTTVFAMHQEPVAWAQLTALVERALN
ncbi:MAG: hypothetical protein ABI356_00250 [Steroidobacteraceae bacterium]